MPSAKKGNKPKLEKPANLKRKQPPTTSKKTTVTKQTASTKEKKSRFHHLTTPRWRNIFNAAAHNDTAAVRYFVERDESLVKSTDEDEKTVILIAAENVNLGIIKYMLEKNGSIDLLMCPDVFGNTVMQRAIEKGSFEIVKYLVEEHNWGITEPNARSFKNTPLHVAAEEGQLEILKYFVEERKADPNVKNELGNPPVFLAADRPNLDVVRYFAEEGKADMKALNNHRGNILFQSAKRGDVTVPKYLLDEKKIELDVNWRDIMNCTIVYTATRYAKYEFLHYIITEHHADLNIVDELGRTALHIAAHQNNYAMCKFFIDHGGSLEVKNVYNNTPVEEATDPKVRGYLDDMFNVLRRERAERGLRSRRGVPSDFHWDSQSETVLTNILLPRVSLGNDEKEMVMSSTFLDRFLIVTDMLVRLLWGTTSGQKSCQVPLTRQEELQRRMDPLAIEAVNASFSFKW